MYHVYTHDEIKIEKVDVICFMRIRSQLNKKVYKSNMTYCDSNSVTTNLRYRYNQTGLKYQQNAEDYFTLVLHRKFFVKNVTDRQRKLIIR